MRELFRDLSASTLLAVVGANVDLGRIVHQAERGLQWSQLLSLEGLLLGLWLPFALVVGVFIAALRIGITHLPESLSLRASLRRPTERSPKAFANVLSFAFGGALLAGGGALAAHHFSTRYHDAALASAVLGIVLVALTAAVAILTMLLRPILLDLGRLLGPFGSLAGALALCGLGVAAALSLALVRFPGILARYGWEGVLLLPVGVLVFVVTRRLFRGLRYSRSIPLMLVAAAFIAFAAKTYGRNNRERLAIEDDAFYGRSLVQVLAGLTDRDGDGFSVAYGGHDCDDSRAWVHPGAVDPAGDGIDADCFDGDGLTRESVVYSDGSFGELPDSLPEQPNILFVTVDALRFDHTSCAAYERDTTPFLRELCDEGSVFENVYAPSTRSIRSIPAFFTGLYPSEIAYGPEYLWPTLLPENDTLAEHLGRAGYRNEAAIGTDYFKDIDGFFQGFAQVQQAREYKPSRGEVVDRALTQLRRLTARNRMFVEAAQEQANQESDASSDENAAQDGDSASQIGVAVNAPRAAPTRVPWFQWTHLFNVHGPYLQDGHASRYGDSQMDKYDTEIRLMDDQLRRLIEGVRAMPEGENTVIVFASDHGEAFYEHGYTGHSRHLYDVELRASLMVVAPGFEPSRIEQRVSLMDLMPTILNLAGTEVSTPIAAHSLVPLMSGEGRGGHDDGRTLFAELLPDGMHPFDQKAVIQGDWKWITWVREGTEVLFHLGDDPGETRDLLDEERERATELQATLRAWLATHRRRGTANEEVIEDELLEAFPTNIEALDCTVVRARLAGFQFEEREVSPGGRINLSLYFEALGRMRQDLFFLVVPEPPEDIRAGTRFHGNHYPLNGRYHTNQWNPGERIEDSLSIVVPRTIRRGVRIPFHVRTNRPFTCIEDGERVQRRRIPLGEIEIR